MFTLIQFIYFRSEVPKFPLDICTLTRRNKPYSHTFPPFRLATQHAEDMSVSRFEEQFHAVNHAQQTLQKMENYLKEKQLCDVLLIAGHLRIPAHR